LVYRPDPRVPRSTSWHSTPTIRDGAERSAGARLNPSDPARVPGVVLRERLFA